MCTVKSYYFLSEVIGPRKASSSKVHLYRIISQVNGSMAILFVGFMAFAPESPRWLILRGKEFSASESLEWLRGRNDAAIDREIEIDVAIFPK